MALPNGFKQEIPPSRYTIKNLKNLPKIKIRVLSDFVTGKCVWGEPEGKRTLTHKRPGEPMPTKAIGWSERYKKPEPVKQFLAAVVFNYTTNQVEVLDLDKAKIISQIVELDENSDWGDAKAYDLTISKSGTGENTRYSVIPSNKAPMAINPNWQAINLDALFTPGADPFADQKLQNDVTSTLQ